MRENTSRTSLTCLALLAGACAAAAATPDEWDIEIVCRSSLDPGTPAFRLPQNSSLSSQYVSLDEQGRIAIRAFLSVPNVSEGIFVGDPEGGSLIITGNSSDPLWSTYLDISNGRLALEDAVIGPSSATVYGLNGSILQQYPQGLYGTDGSLALADDGAIGYRAYAGLAGQAVLVDEYIAGERIQTEALSTLDPDVNIDFILSPSMNGSRQFSVNVLPSPSPSRRIYRLSPDGAGDYINEIMAETGPNADGNFSSFVNSTAISNDGRVAFNARRAADSIWQVNRRDDPASPIVKIAEGGQMGIVNGNLANFPPVVNSNGLVAFRVEDSAGSTALYVGDGTESESSLVRIIGYGDTVMTDLGELAVGFDFGGTTGVQVMNGVVDINDSDQVAFAAFLENGTIGVFIATPAGDPGCNAADIAEPFGVLDLADVQAFISAFQNQEAAADIAEPFGVWDLADLQSFVTEFNAGCP